MLTKTTTNNLKTLFEHYITECQYSKGLRAKTLKSYSEVFSTFQKIMPEIRLLDDLHPHMMHEFFKRISTRKRIVGKNTIKTGVKPSTTKTYYNKLIAFFRWLESHSYLAFGELTSKMVAPPNPVYDDERALSEHEVSKIIASITLYGMKDTFQYKRDVTIVSLLLYTGIRKGELLGLRVQDINLENRSLYIKGQTSKSKKSRSIPLHFSLVSHLKTYLNERKKRGSTSDALIISSKSDSGLSAHGLKHWVKKYSKLSGVKFHVHRFRHTFACQLARQNADITSIMNVMGHSSIRMTERYLRSIKSESARSYIEKLDF